MRADIHDGPEQMLQSKAGYIDARPLTASSTKISCNARPDHTSGSRAAVAGRLMAQPVHPQLRKYPCVPAFRHLRFVPRAGIPAPFFLWNARVPLFLDCRLRDTLTVGASGGWDENARVNGCHCLV